MVADGVVDRALDNRLWVTSDRPDVVVVAASTSCSCVVVSLVADSDSATADVIFFGCFVTTFEMRSVGSGTRWTASTPGSLVAVLPLDVDVAVGVDCAV